MSYLTVSVDEEQAFLAAMRETPNDRSLRMVFADWLEERGDPRGELLRLTHTLTQEAGPRWQDEQRLQELLKEGVQPIGPFWTNTLGMKFAWIPAGTFLMGSPESEKGRYDDETQHTVTLTKGFYMGVHLVTQEQWQAVMGSNPSHFKGEKNLPVENVSWDDCQHFLARLSKEEGLGRTYRLPWESEWEYACRAGTTTPFHFGETISTDQANYDGKHSYGKGKKGVYRKKTLPVGSFPANSFGLCDMHGNLWEWCQDWYGEYEEGKQNSDPTPRLAHSAAAVGSSTPGTAGRRTAPGTSRAPGSTAWASVSPAVDSQVPRDGSYRVLRGGSWYSLPEYCRSARYCSDASILNYNVGLRVCCCLG